MMNEKALCTPRREVEILVEVPPGDRPELALLPESHQGVTEPHLSSFLLPRFPHPFFLADKEAGGALTCPAARGVPGQALSTAHSTPSH